MKLSQLIEQLKEIQTANSAVSDQDVEIRNEQNEVESIESLDNNFQDVVMIRTKNAGAIGI